MSYLLQKINFLFIINNLKLNGCLHFGIILEAETSVYYLEKDKYTVEPVLSSHSKRRQKIGFQDRLSPIKCRSKVLEHSAILSTYIKLAFVIKIFVLSIFEWSLKTGFTVLDEILVLISHQTVGKVSLLCFPTAFPACIHIVRMWMKVQTKMKISSFAGYVSMGIH